jgi:hypothetical protein
MASALCRNPEDEECGRNSGPRLHGISEDNRAPTQPQYPRNSEVEPKKDTVSESDVICEEVPPAPTSPRAGQLLLEIHGKSIPQCRCNRG